MKVVMVTGDIEEIDRRIIQEAVTLRMAGHQVVVIAPRSAGQQSIEEVREIPIIRIPDQTSDWLETKIRAVFGRLSRLVTYLMNSTEGTRSASKSTPHTTDDLDTLQVTQPYTSLRNDSMIPWLKVQSTTTFLCRAVIFLSRQVRSISPRDTELARAILSHSPDVIHVHDAPQLQAGAIAASERKTPLIYDSHELWTGISALSKFQRGRIRRLEETTIPRCSAVITVNGHVAEEIQRLYRSKRPTVILNSVDTLTVPGKTDRLRQAFRISSNERIVLYQGWFSPERGIDLLLRAMCHTNSRTHLVLMGYGEYIEELMSIASKLGIADRVHHKHKVPQSELLEWTASADVGVIPYPAVDLNHRLCSPNKLFEFIQADLRVIGNDLPFLREVIVGDRIGLVAAIDNEAEFGSAIEQVAWCGGDEIQRYESALKSARDRYSWELQAELLLATYSAIHRLEGI